MSESKSTEWSDKRKHNQSIPAFQFHFFLPPSSFLGLCFLPLDLLQMEESPTSTYSFITIPLLTAC